MFDANARHIPLGVKFFAKVHSVDTKLTSFGLISGDIILCEIKDKSDPDNPVVEIWTEQDKGWGSYEYQYDEESLYGWVTYEGLTTGEDFICDKSKYKALKFLGGDWL